MIVEFTGEDSKYRLFGMIAKPIGYNEVSCTDYYDKDFGTWHMNRLVREYCMHRAGVLLEMLERKDKAFDMQDKLDAPLEVRSVSVEELKKVAAEEYAALPWYMRLLDR